MTAMNPTDLLDRTFHLNTSGGQYDGRFTVVDARRLGDSLQLTGTWHAPSGDIPRTMTVRPWCIHETRAAALDAGIRTRAAIRARRLDADAARHLSVTRARAAHRALPRATVR